MGKRGTKNTPTALKLVHGARKDRINTEEPVPSAGEIVPPTELSEGAQEVWDRLAPDLIHQEVLTPWDVDEFVGFCDAVDRRDGAREQLDEQGEVVEADVFNRNGEKTGVRIVLNPWWQVWKASNEAVMKYGARFGLSPSERSQIKTGGNSGQGSDDYFD